MKLDALGRRKRTDNFCPTGKKIVLGDYDYRIFNLLRRYRWLPSTYIIALLGLKPGYAKHRLSDLRKEAGLLFCPDDGWGRDKKTQAAVYGLTEAGERLAGPALKFGNKVKHDLLTCISMASLELGAQEHGLPTYEWEQLQKSPYCTAKDWKLPLSTFNEKGRPRVLDPDWPPRAIGNDPRFYFLGTEVDRDTEIGVGDAHKTISRMFEDLFEVLENKTAKALGIPRFLIPILTIKSTRLRELIEILERVANGRRTDAFIFTVVSDILTKDYDFPKPSGELLSRDWITTKGTFNILQKLKGGDANGRSETGTHSGAEAAA